LVKQRRQNKTTSPYDPKPCTITEVKGSQIKATKSNRKVITQHKAFFKRLRQPEKRRMCSPISTKWAAECSPTTTKWADDSEEDDINTSNSEEDNANTSNIEEDDDSTTNSEEEIRSADKFQHSTDTNSNTVPYMERMEAPTRPHSTDTDSDTIPYNETPARPAHVRRTPARYRDFEQ